jgi:hypothetical protein
MFIHNLRKDGSQKVARNMDPNVKSQNVSNPMLYLSTVDILFLHTVDL